jgi:inactivated superfamily I helicase
MIPACANEFTHTVHTEQPAASRRRLSLAHTRIVAPFASDPELTMRREIKLLRIEVEQLRALEDMLRAEIDILRARQEDACNAEAFLLAYVEQVEQLRESRDYWEGEAKRLSGLKPQRWFRWWRDRSRILNGFLRAVSARLAPAPSLRSLFAAR